MEELPNELIDQICGHLAVTNMESLKNLRLVSHRYAPTAIKHIFRSLLVYQHFDKWENINRIAKTPKLAIAVEAIKLVHQPSLLYVNTFEEWCRAADALLQELQGVWCYWNNCQFQDLIRGDQMGMKKAYGSYRYWLKGEAAVARNLIITNFMKTMKWTRSKQNVSDLQLERFPRLTNLETIGRQELCKLHALRYGSSFRHFTRRDVETLIDERQASKNEVLSRRLSNAHDGGNNLQLFLLARERNGKAIPNMRLHHFPELLRHPDVRKTDIDFSCLKNLQIDLTATAHQYHSWLGKHTWLFFSQWVPSITGLEKLTIVQDPDTKTGVDLLEFLASLNFPNLHTLHLIRVTTRIEASSTVFESSSELANVFVHRRTCNMAE